MLVDQPSCERCGVSLPQGESGSLCDRCLLDRNDLAEFRSKGGLVSPSEQEVRVQRRAARRPRWAKGTYGLLIVNALVFAVLSWTGGSENQLVLLHWGAKSNDLIWAGEFWRFLTPIFIHIGWMHLIGNGVALWVFGRLLENLIGTPRFIAIYLLSGVCGVIAGFCFHDQLSAGASGAFFGLLGGLLAFITVNKAAYRHFHFRELIGFLTLIGCLLAAGLQHRNIDNWAHLGGLIGGYLGGLVLVQRLPGLVPRPRLRVAGGLLLLCLLWGCLSRGWSWMSHIRDGQVAYARRDFQKAREAFRKAVTLRPRPTLALWALARIDMSQGNLKDAEKNLMQILEMDPENPDAHYHLADLCRETGRPEDALKQMEKTYRLDPNRFPGLRLRLGRAHLESGNAKKAIPVLEEAVARGEVKDDPLVEYSLGDALRKTGQIEKGTQHLKRYEEILRAIVETKPTAVGFNNLAWFLLEDGQKPTRMTEAAQFASKAVESEPFNPYFLGTLGCVRYYQGRYQEALDCLEKALSRHLSRADSATDFYFAAMAAFRLGDRQKASQYLQKAEKIDSRNRYRNQARREQGLPEKEG